MFGLFTTPAIASTAAPAATVSPAGGVMSMLPLLLIFGIFYFLVIRPQQKKMREHTAMLNRLERGDKVVTAGGVRGTIKQVDEKDVVVTIAPEVHVTVLKSSISTVETKGQPLKEKLAAEKKAANTN